MRARFFGQYLVASGHATAQQLLSALEYQERTNTKLGSTAVSLGLATPFEVEQILALQAKEDLLFGEAAVRLGLLDESAVQRVRDAQQDRHVQLGEALVALGHLEPATVETAAAAFLAAEAELEPEVVTVPPDMPLHDVAFELFYLAHKLLLRVCDVTSKTERLRVLDGVMPLADHNARVVLNGGATSSVYLCMPRAIAREVASRYSGELAPADDEVDEIVLGLAELLSDNLVSVLAERGLRVESNRPVLVAGKLSSPPGARVAWVPFVTHRGQVLVGLSLPAQPG